VGVPNVLAPIRSRTGALSARHGASWLTVYPFVEGGTGTDTGLTERHWRELGALVGRLHTIELPPAVSELLTQETYRPTETYRPDAIDLVHRIDRAVADAPLADPPAALGRDRRDEILRVVECTEELGARLERAARPLVVCHADLHTWNMLIDGDGGLWVIDWDSVTLAPKERDLMFVVGGIGAGLVAPHETAWFLEAYGGASIDPLALAYYRHAWAVQDLAGFGERLFLSAEDDRAAAAGDLEHAFAPGEIVEMALGSCV
jgi:spectinomycin phosphotransferase